MCARPILHVFLDTGGRTQTSEADPQADESPPRLLLCVSPVIEVYVEGGECWGRERERETQRRVLSALKIYIYEMDLRFTWFCLQKCKT